jgi:hypothetical protein
VWAIPLLAAVAVGTVSCSGGDRSRQAVSDISAVDAGSRAGDGDRSQPVGSVAGDDDPRLEARLLAEQLVGADAELVDCVGDGLWARWADLADRLDPMDGTAMRAVGAIIEECASEADVSSRDPIPEWLARELVREALELAGQATDEPAVTCVTEGLRTDAPGVLEAVMAAEDTATDREDARAVFESCLGDRR